MKKNNNLRGKSPPDHIPNFMGPIGETLLDRPFYWLLETEKDGYEYKKLEKDIASLFLQENYRLLVLDSALLLEEKIDLLLSSVIPGFKTLSKNRDLTLSLKIDLLKSLKLIPLKLFNGIEIVRKLRNKIAHKLDCDALELIKKDKDKIYGQLTKFYNQTELQKRE